MQVHLSFDIEVWCNGWASLDQSFPAAFERYVYGRSPQGAYALPRTLEIMQEHGLRGVFFVEPLFSLRFGQRYLRTITELISQAGQDVQLHLHPEWVDEIRPPLLADVAHKRQHLTHYRREEQAALLRAARDTLQAVLSTDVYAFRAGSYAVNQDTYQALNEVGLRVDSSLNDLFDYSAGSIAPPGTLSSLSQVAGVSTYPVTSFTDGFGKPRPMQVGACSFAEMRDVLDSAHDAGLAHLVLVSHNFEMLRPGSSLPDPVVVRRFEDLCAFLAAHPQRFQVGSYPRGPRPFQAQPRTVRPRAGWSATVRRHVEQALRRLQSR